MHMQIVLLSCEFTNQLNRNIQIDYYHLAFLLANWQTHQPKTANMNF